MRNHTTTTLLLLILIIFLFNLNFGAGISQSQITGEGSLNFLAKSISTTPFGTISASDCMIPNSESLCDSTLNWSTQGLTPGVTEVTHNNPNNTHVSFATSGTNVDSSVTFGPTTFYLYHNIDGTPTLLASVPMSADCAPGGGGEDWTWDGSQCVLYPPECPPGTIWDDISHTCVSNVTLTFGADPSSIYSGASSTLTWNSNATSCTTGTPESFNPGGLPGENAIVTPLSTLTYSITCDGVTATTTVTVKKKPAFIEN